MTQPESDALVFFGATGDLAYKKIFSALQALIRAGDLDIPIIGMARAGWTLNKLRERARDSLENNGGLDADAFARLSAQMQYVDGDYSDPATYQRLKQTLGAATRPLHYMAIPPSMFGSVVLGLAKAGCAEGARIIVEKPFATSRPRRRSSARCTRSSRSRRYSESITTSARKAYRTCCTSISPTHSSNRSGTGTTSQALTHVSPELGYEPGSWGPPAAVRVVVNDEGWHDPKPEQISPC